MGVWCTFDVDGEAVDMALDRLPRKEEYPNIFPASRCVSLTQFRYSEDAGVPVGIAKWPVYSDGAGCNPKQIPAMKKLVPELDYTRDGRAIFHSPGHRRKCLKKLGMVDRSSFI